VNTLYSKPVRIIGDFIGLMLAYIGTFYLRTESGLFIVRQTEQFYLQSPGIFVTGALMSGTWLVFFYVLGHYSSIYTTRWLDNFKKISLTVLLGGLILFWLTFEAESPLPSSRLVIISYGLGIAVFCATIRSLLFLMQQLRWRSGKDLLRTAIIGYGRWADVLADEFSKRRENGHEYIGAIQLPGYEGKMPEPVLGHFHDLEKILSKNHLDCVVLAWETGHAEEVLQGIMICNHGRVQVQVCPDLRDSAASWARLQTRDDLPLFVVKSDFHPNWERLLNHAVGGTNA